MPQPIGYEDELNEGPDSNFACDSL
jgi:hypothetical protein